MILYSAKMVAFSLKELTRPKVAPLAPYVLEGRAWPWLCDYQRHINNARYLDLMDYGRTQFFLRAGLLKALATNGWGGVVASTQITYRRSIDLMQRYRLETRLVFWDDRWYIHEHIFYLEDGTVAVHAFIRSMLRGKDGAVNLSRVFEAAGLSPETPTQSDALAQFLASSEFTARSLRG